MADNLTLNAGSGGSTLATDDVTDAGGAHYQRVKLTDGTANSETHIQADGGTEANALRVTIANDSTGLLSVDDNGGSLTIDNTNIDNLNSSDFDTGAGTDTTPSIGIAVPASGGAAVITGDATNGLDVDVTRVSGTVTVDGSGVTQPVSDAGGSLTVDNAALSVTGGGAEATALRVTLANDSTGVVSVDDGGGALTVDNGGTFAVQVDAALPAGTNAIGKLAANSGVDIGDVDITSIAAGTNLIGDVGLSGARTSGGTTLYRNVDVDETEDAVKASGGQLYWLHAMNLTASVLYLQFYNATVASVTVGTTTPDLTFPLPTQGDTNGAGFTIAIPNGIAFGTAITIACTTTIGGASGPAANGCIVNLGYA